MPSTSTIRPPTANLRPIRRSLRNAIARIARTEGVRGVEQVDVLAIGPQLVHRDAEVHVDLVHGEVERAGEETADLERLLQRLADIQLAVRRFERARDDERRRTPPDVAAVGEIE